MSHEGGFPDTGNGGQKVVGNLRTVDLGNGVIAVMDDAGNVFDLRSVPSAPSAPSGPPASYYAAQVSQGQRQLDQYDRDLAFRIDSSARELEEKKRQFDVSMGFEREKLAAEIKMLERRLENDLIIAKLDSSTRLQVANIEAAVSRRGQNIQARSIAVNELGNDPIRQSLFMTGVPEEAGRTPLEITRPGFNQEFGIENVIPGAAGGASVQLRDRPVALRVGEGGEEIVIAGKNRLDVIPMHEGGTIMSGPNLIPQREEAFRTLRLALSKALQGGRAPAFGGITMPIRVPGVGTELPPPENIARRLLGMRPTDPRRRLILSALGVAGFSPEESLARARAATPVASFSGLTRVT